MAKILDQATQTQISQKNISAKFTFTINGVDYTNYVLDWSISYSTQFGSASATFTLDNNLGYFGSGGTAPINIGDVVSLQEQFSGSSTIWKSFYGKVEQRTFKNEASNRTISLTCLDYISVLKQWDINLVCEGTKIEVNNEILQPQFLPSPNASLAQVFNFANDALADQPRPIITFRDKNHLSEDPQYDGFDIHYNTGQLKLGSPLQALDNYDVVAKSYYFYTEGIYCEDVLEQILTQVDGYGGYLFGETSANDVITKHLQTTYYAEEGTTGDVMTPNYTTSTVVMRFKVTHPVSAGDTSVYLETTLGLPSNGEASINGDIFVWTNKVSGHVLAGIDPTGSHSLSAHPAGSYVEFTTTYPSGQVWYLKYSNLVSDLIDNNFTIPGGASMVYLDKRNGRIILDTNINLTSVVTCDIDYTFKTLQTSGVELNYISFRPREMNNRYEAIEKLRKYLPPNYIIRTQGDSKIWSSLMYQKTEADYNLNLISSINYMEDEDLYTRVIMYGKNNNPTNLMFNPDISFGTTGSSYKAYASQSELLYDHTEGNFTYWVSAITNAGKIVLDDYVPVVYINGVPVDNKLHQMTSQPIKIQLVTRTETTTTTSGGKDPQTTTETRTYYYYTIYFPHQSLEPSQDIIIYDLHGAAQITIPANSGGMDYGNAVYAVPGSSQNNLIETLSTATYWVLYSTQNVVIDYDTATFKINQALIPDITRVTVQASFEYYAVFTPLQGTGSITDGRWDTQLQTEFYAEPPSGYEYAIIDFGSLQTIQAVDVVAGFYKPDTYRKFDIDFRFTLLYSINGTDYYEIGDKTHNVQLTGGSSVSFDENDLGIGFTARYFKVILESVKKIDFGAVKDSSGRIIREGLWAVALSEVSAYGNIVLKSEAKLIPTTYLTDTVDGSGTIYVESTEGFTDPGSGETAVAYINNLLYKSFTYTGLTPTSFVGVTLISGCSGDPGDTVSQTITSSSTLLDPDALLPKMGDRLYKNLNVDDSVLYDQSALDVLALSYLREYYKNHSKLNVDILYTPYLKLGQTVSLTDPYNYITNGLYFIEAISCKPGGYALTLGKYP